jgi:uncharacterized protein (DUF885 family)
VTTPDAATELDRLAADYWDAFLERHPTFATAIGDRRFDALLTDETDAGRAAWRRTLDEFAGRLDRLTDDGDPTTRAALAEAIRSDRAGLEADLEAFTVDPMDGPQSSLLNLPAYQRARDATEATALLGRWQAIARFVDTAGENLRRGVRDGRFGVASLVHKVIEQLDGLLARPDADWPLSRPDGDDPTLADRAERIVAEEIRPALGRYRTLLADEIAPHARPDDRPGLAHVPGGAEAYALVARAHTSLDVAPEEVHRIGLAEIERIDAEFVDVGRRLLRTSDLPSTLRALRQDPALHFSTGDEVFETARASLDRANAAIPAWFGRLPQAPCEVVRMPAHEEKHSTIAYYREPSADGSRPGQYYVNTFAPETRPRYEAETLAFHESVPGHHLQLAIMQELDTLPAFRRFHGTTAYIEGWGLYTERLSEEMGLLSGDLDRFGVLSFDAWRASRLVVDTGMHALGWTRQAAVDFMTEHTALAPNNIANEVDRYIAWPGQALAYKLGQLEILRLRDDARARQGDRFDIRAFHDAVLTSGALPLPVLRQVVEAALP